MLNYRGSNWNFKEHWSPTSVPASSDSLVCHLVSAFLWKDALISANEGSMTDLCPESVVATGDQRARRQPPKYSPLP